MRPAERTPVDLAALRRRLQDLDQAMVAVHSLVDALERWADDQEEIADLLAEVEAQQ